MILDKRNKIQLFFTVITNSYFKGFLNGTIYQGKLKKLCFPGLNCYSCPGALGSCPLGSIQNVFASMTNQISFYILGVLMLFGVLFGRVICGFLCPFGLFQDLIYKLKLFKLKKQKNLPLHKYIKHLRYFFLMFFVVLMPLFLRDNLVSAPYFCKYICPSGTFMAGLFLILKNEQYFSIIGSLFALKMIIMIIIFILSIKYYRPFCKYICPLGAIYGFFNPIAIYRFEIKKDKCISCKRCQKTCPMDIKVYQNPNSFDCIRCQRCLKVCPTKALETDNIIKNKFFTKYP